LALADYILALHNDIHEVLILEERAGEYVVIGEASRKGLTLLADNLNIASKQRLLAPTIMLGIASQLGGQQSKLVGIEYERAGLVFAPLNENKLLALSTIAESLRDVSQTISAALPQLKQRLHEIPAAVGGVMSAVEAEGSVRYFLTERFPRESSRIIVERVSHRSVDQRWEVHGSFRSGIWSSRKRFLVEVDAQDGTIKGFAYSSTSSLFVLAAIGCIVAAGLLALMLFAGLWKF
jgi:hypothetical protein